MEGIGNTLERFVAVENDFSHTYDKRKVKILVELDLSTGLPAEVDIICNDRVIRQRIDYLNVPFRCSYCRAVGHL